MRKFIYWLRIAAQHATLLLIVSVILLCGVDYDALSLCIMESWPYIASVICIYALLTVGEDYLNARALAPRS